MRQASEATLERYASLQDVNRAALATMSWEDQDESRKQRLIPVNTTHKYVFRIKPGTMRSFNVRIPTLPDDFVSDKAEKRYTERFGKREAVRNNGKYDLNKVRDAVGGDWIGFKNLPGGPNQQSSSYYETSDEDVYQFLMRCKETDTSGNWDNIFVEYPNQKVTVNGKTYPATEAGWKAAQAAMTADDISASE